MRIIVKESQSPIHSLFISERGTSYPDGEIFCEADSGNSRNLSQERMRRVMAFLSRCHRVVPERYTGVFGTSQSPRGLSDDMSWASEYDLTQEQLDGLQAAAAAVRVRACCSSYEDVAWHRHGCRHWTPEMATL